MSNSFSPEMLWFVLSLFFFGITVIALLNRNKAEMQTKWLMMVRPFFPKWQFYGEVQPVIGVQWRPIAGSDSDEISWRPMELLAEGPPKNPLFWGGKNIVRHTVNNHLQQFIFDISNLNPSDVGNSTTYKMTEAWVGDAAKAAGNENFEFRVTLDYGPLNKTEIVTILQAQHVDE